MITVVIRECECFGSDVLPVMNNTRKAIKSFAVVLLICSNSSYYVWFREGVMEGITMMMQI